MRRSSGLLCRCEIDTKLYFLAFAQLYDPCSVAASEKNSNLRTYVERTVVANDLSASERVDFCVWSTEPRQRTFDDKSAKF